MTDAGHNLLFYLRLEEICEKVNCEALCSAGTIAHGKTCRNCKAGSYNEQLGSVNCIECKPGSFNQNKSSSSSQQCHPCPEGSYNSEYGANVCKACPSDKYCPVGSLGYSEQHNIQNRNSIQPPLYEDPNLNKSIIIYQILVSVPIFLVMVLLFTFKKLRVWAKKLDFFDDKHPNFDSEFMVRKKNLIGACFSFLVITGGLLLTCSSILEYFKANVFETKGLVTLSVLEADVGGFEAETLSVEVLLFSYGGECGNKLKESISMISENIRCTQRIFTLEKIGNNSCKIRISFSQASINSSAVLIFTLNENPSYSSGIQVNLTSSSSIPNQISSVSTNIHSVTNSVFIGPAPTKFNFLVTPSLFKSESNQWKEYETGYHISERSNPEPGSMFKAEDLFSVSFLNIKVAIEKSSTGLLTQRKLKQYFMFFVGSLLGSVSGLFGIAGFVMTVFEKQLGIILKKVTSKNFNTMKISKLNTDFTKVIPLETTIDKFVSK